MVRLVQREGKNVGRRERENNARRRRRARRGLVSWMPYYFSGNSQAKGCPSGSIQCRLRIRTRKPVPRIATAGRIQQQPPVERHLPKIVYLSKRRAVDSLEKLVNPSLWRWCGHAALIPSHGMVHIANFRALCLRCHFDLKAVAAP